ncbi:isoleucyl-tRNA synthetase [Acidimicrobium ferrooxidans DSM 10331]|uniref:Isoleucine--tRNA ligase n=1 Tax=Acidimicrobium ferrooxidans (strain DSM 10331 / JCM 15462 / NBRC 103882 / ICP) TaxID=525909 RepID=C7LZI6_ACIFD|nr:isoleucine--tRNA ligase [Acidimicrobium ferrooxidans]ACU54144.1 isoleucyl-tRNA synthetase [Acidimicrobium ferrooxidans DSM 10331]
MDEAPEPYPAQPATLDLPALEHDVLASWEREGTFAASIERRRAEGAPAFVFYDGPPFANGLPHYGHLLTGFVKDAVPRYQTMRGKLVERRFGWDCHGLPAEMAVEKELGLTSREDIERVGVGVFNDHCRALVDHTSDEWDRYVTRQARWVDFEHAYRTMDLPFMESVMWAFKRLYDRGLIYEHYRVLPYCWECETPLSNFETRQDDAYRPRIDPAVTVAFAVEGDPRLAGTLEGPLWALAWTTTPWTLPSNLALAVNPAETYVLVRSQASDQDAGRTYVLAEARLGAYADRFPDAEVLARVAGRDLVGRRFAPLFPFFADTPGAFVILGADFVTLDEGTGIVQLAPGFGEEDQQVCEANGIPVVVPVDDRGRYTAEVEPWAGVQVFEANPAIIEVLRDQGALITQEDYEHSYPHCWRTETPLIYRAMSSWFVAVTALKDRLLAENESIDWVPAHVKHGAFGKWLEGARDWSITRNRYWGAPIPVWRSDDPAYPRIDVYGSLDELERDFGVRPSDLHRPAIDELVRPNPDDPTGRSMMRRVPDVLDCWFESGSMPFAQLHYPFENKERFEANFPADFIVEYVGQTRGWFYTLHVLAVALFDRPPFRHCIAHGIVLGNDGRKLSKRLRNYPDPWEVFEEIGADAMRWFLLSSPILRGQEMLLERSAMVDTVRRVINPLWNTFNFLVLYARADHLRGQRVHSATHVLDRYLLAATHDLVVEVTDAMDHFELSRATTAVERHLDRLTNWYVRRSRSRFWSRRDDTTEDAKREAYDTLHTALETLALVTAPLLPMLSEHIYRTLTNEASVHLADWPNAEALPSDPTLVAQMERVREVCSLAHSIRKAAGLRARLPLRRLTVVLADPFDLEPYVELIRDEVNVKEVVVEPAAEHPVTWQLSVNPRVLGPRLGARVQDVIRAAREGRFDISGDRVTCDGVELAPDEFTLTLATDDPKRVRSFADRRGLVILETTVDDELEREGLARDLIRLVQQHRKDHGYEIVDRIRLAIALDRTGRVQGALAQHANEVLGECLATELILDDAAALDLPDRSQVTIGGEQVTIATEPVRALTEPDGQR